MLQTQSLVYNTGRQDTQGVEKIQLRWMKMNI